MRSHALPPSALRARLCYRAFGLLLAAVLLDSPSVAPGAAAALPPRTLALTNVTIIDCTGAAPQPGMTVLIRGERIVDLGKTGILPVPKDAQVVNGRGKYLIPGLWDMHVHVTDRAFSKMFLVNGVTGVRHMYTAMPRWFTAPEWRQPARNGPALWPRLVGADRMLDGPDPALAKAVGQKIVKVKDEASARRAVRTLTWDGEDFIKVHSLLPRKAYAGAALEAHRQRMPLIGHVPHEVRVLEAVMAGQKSIEHLSGMGVACSPQELALLADLARALRGGKMSPFDRATAWRYQVKGYRAYDRARAEELFRYFVQHGTWHVPTLVQKRTWGQLDNPAFTDDERLKYLPFLLRLLWRVERDNVGGVNLPVAGPRFTARDMIDHRFHYHKDLEVVGAMHRAGVRLLAGTDTPSLYSFPGFGLHDELALLCEAGLTPLEALQTATRNPAQFLGKEKDLGTVEKGKIADLVLLDANPLAYIRNTRKVHAVVLGGKLIDQRARQAMLAELAGEKRK